MVMQFKALNEAVGSHSRRLFTISRVYLGILVLLALLFYLQPAFCD